MVRGSKRFGVTGAGITTNEVYAHVHYLKSPPVDQYLIDLTNILSLDLNTDEDEDSKNVGGDPEGVINNSHAKGLQIEINPGARNTLSVQMHGKY